jgi:isoleucyl-tRNA synthetase
LYCERPDGPKRRATQTVLHAILDTLVRLMAPVLSFTADEVWSFMPATTEPSVFLAGFSEPPTTWGDEALAARFERLLAVRAAVTKALEAARHGGVVKQGTEARITLAADGELGELLASRLADLPALFVVAEVALDGGGAESPIVPGLRVGVERAAGDKCERCWLTRPLGSDPRHPGLCERCTTVVG